MRTLSVPVVLALVALAYLAQNSWTLSRYSTRDFPTFYCAAAALTESKDPYDLRALREVKAERGVPGRQLFPYIYPPVFAVALVPLSRLSFTAANRAWAILSHLSLAASLVLLARAFPRDGNDDRVASGDGDRAGPLVAASLGAAALFFHPVTNTLEHGQVNHVLLLLLLAYWSLRRSGRPVLAGSALGAAAVLKMSPALLVAFALLKREWRLAGAAAATAAVLWTIATMAAGSQATVAFLGSALPTLGYGGEPPGLFASGAIWNGSWNGLSARLGMLVGLPPAVTPLLAYAAGVWLLVSFARASRRAGARPGEDDGETAAVVVLMLLLSSWTYHHHFVLLLPVLALLLRTRSAALVLALAALASVEWSAAADHWSAVGGALASVPAILLAGLLALLWPRAAAGSPAAHADLEGAPA